MPTPAPPSAPPRPREVVGDAATSTTPRLVRHCAERFGDAIAIEDGEVRLSFAALAEAARCGARGLLAAGIEHGDRVALWAPNSWEWVVAALVVHSVGAVLVPINTRFKGAEAAWVLAKSRARMLLTVTDFLGVDYVRVLRDAAVELPCLERIVLLRGAAGGGSEGWASLVGRGERVSIAEADAHAAGVSENDVSDILFTSGTTGHPKGVMSTHGQTLRAFRTWSDTVGLRAGDRYLVVVPFFHSFGYKAGWLACLLTGATLLPQAVFDVDVVLARIARDRITVLPGPPTLYQSILAHPNRSRFDLSSLRLAVTGAATIPVELIERMRGELAFETVLTAYGLTEATGVSTMCHADDDARTIATTSGRAIEGVEVGVVDDDGCALPAGTPGEVVVRGYTVMKGYFDDPDETAAAIDAAGWLHTGDIGVLDERGNLRIVDRKKDMFVVGGFNAYPAEIERTILQHEAVAQAAVVGAPDDRLGEVGVAFVVLSPGATLDAEALIAWCRDRMANYKVPRRVVVVDALPTNATGKVVKYALRERARATEA